MKLFIKLFLLILILAAGASYWYWHSYKKGIFKYFLQHTISSKTDSLYYLRYDSSHIDEINGNAYFRNVYLQSDSEQQVILKSTDSLPNVLFNVYIKSVKASGIDMAAALRNNELHAKKIIIDEPYIQLINTGSNQLQIEDTIALYKKMVGEFKSINADSIIIRNGVFVSKNRRNEIQSSLSRTTILLTKFKIDSTCDYTNVVSYFINNVVATVDTISVHKNNGKGVIQLAGVNYNSSAKSLMIKCVQSIAENGKTSVVKLNQLELNELNIEEFIERHRLQAGMLYCKGGEVTVYTNKHDASTNELSNKSFDFPEKFFDEIELGCINLGNTTFIIRNKQFPEREPVTVRNVTFNVTNEINVVQGKTIRNIIDHAKWKIDADGFTFITEDKLYAISVQGISIDRQKNLVSIEKFGVKPTISETQFVSRAKKQTDYYTIEINHIKLAGIDFSKLLSQSMLDMQQANLKVNLNVFTDRTLPINTASKVGKYPQQLLLKLKIPIYIKKVVLENSFISYRERALESKQIGDVRFTNVNASIDNVTNIPAYIHTNPVCVINAKGLLLNKATASTQWKLLLNTTDGTFDVKGEIKKMDAAILNSIGMPLGMTSVSGDINGLTFSMTGNNYKTKGSLEFLYSNFKLASYKMDEKGDTLKNKKMETWFGNALIIDNNPANGKTRTADISADRELNKSFFNLVWKSIFGGIQKTILSKGGAELQKRIKRPKIINKAAVIK